MSDARGKRPLFSLTFWSAYRVQFRWEVHSTYCRLEIHRPGASVRSKVLETTSHARLTIEVIDCVIGSWQKAVSNVMIS
jgi:hypothetical protein